MPDATATAKKWREIAAKYGLELYLCHMVFDYNPKGNRLVEGFDAAIDFEPFGVRRIHEEKNDYSVVDRIAKKVITKLVLSANRQKRELSKLPIRDYRYMYENLVPLKDIGYKIYPSLVPGWDNTARRQKNPILILDNSSPDNFREWLLKITWDFKPYSAEENFIFINAWNEWAEGNHLEPCSKWGSQYLETVKTVFNTQ